jgi:glutamate-1-semialdehyde 2,1-aminomutase
MCNAMEKLAKKHKKKIIINRFQSMFTVFFTGQKVINYKTAALSDTKKYANYFLKMLNRGIYLAPSQFEANFLSFAHTKKDIEYTIDAFEKTIISI